MEPNISRYFQKQIDEFQAEICMAGYSEMKRGLEDLSRDPQLYRFIFVDKGSASVQVGESAFRAEAGQMFLVPAGVGFTIRVDESELCACYYCHFASAQAELPLIDSMDFPLYVWVGNRLQVRQLYRKMLTIYNSNAVTRKLKLRSSLLELFALYVDESIGKLSLSPQTEVDWDKVLAYIDARLDSPITVEDLAGVAYLHPNYFITLFKTVMGCSPIQYVTQRRIVTAKRLLTDTEMTVTEIANRVGMLNHYLSRQFKRMTGVTPLQYRKYAQFGIEHVTAQA